MKPIDLHLISWNRPKMTELVIKTIHRNTKRENFRLVVLDQGSGRWERSTRGDYDKSTADMLLDMQENGLIDELILLPGNIGLEPARTKLLFESTYSPYFVCIDNDCLPEPIGAANATYDNPLSTDWLVRLVDLMEKHEDYAAIACRTQVMIGTGNIFEEADKSGEELVDFPWPGGSLRIMRTEETRKTGGWRELKGRGQEERYICGKLQDAGFKTGFATDIRTLHLFGTRGRNGTDKWGYPRHWKPNRSGHSRVSHPALVNGDDYEEVKKYSGEELTKEYFDA